MMKSIIKINHGFTIVETLVAVAILMISIAGPLTIAQKGLMAAIYARDQSVAAFLAQDAVEYIKNYRENNDWDTWSNKFSSCTQSSPCNIDTTQDNTQVTSSLNLMHDNSGYRPYTAGGVASQFYRKFYLITSINGNPHESRLIVEVSWNNGTISNVVTLENELFKLH